MSSQPKVDFIIDCLIHKSTFNLQIWREPGGDNEFEQVKPVTCHDSTNMALIKVCYEFFFFLKKLHIFLVGIVYVYSTTIYFYSYKTIVRQRQKVLLIILTITRNIECITSLTVTFTILF